MTRPYSMFVSTTRKAKIKTTKSEHSHPQIKILGNASVVLYANDLAIYVDPCSSQVDYSFFPAADLILITHDHYDHFDQKALNLLCGNKTFIIANQTVKQLLNIIRPDLKVRLLRNGENVKFVNDITIKAIAAYNIKNIRPDTGHPYHSKGIGNGYVINFPGTSVYIAGDTELIPEMKNLGKIDIAILPKMHPFTMDCEDFIDAVKLIKPKILYPYHCEELDRKSMKDALPGIEIR